MLGQAGDDTISGEAGNDILEGGAGNDTVSETDSVAIYTLSKTVLAGNGNDTLFDVFEKASIIITGGTTANTFVLIVGDNAFTGQVTLDGGGGTDIVMVSGAFTSVTLTNTLLMGVGVASGGVALVSIEKASVITTSTSGSTIDVRGFGTPTTQLRFAPITTLTGGSGADKIYGSQGQDPITGNSGNDSVNGFQSADKLFGNAGNDKLRGGYDSDTLDGNDTLDGGDGDDTIAGGFAGDSLLGGSASVIGSTGGDDVLSGGVGNDTLNGQDGADTLLGNDGADNLQGGNGLDLLISGVNGFISGVASGDTHFGDRGIDKLDDGAETGGGDTRVDTANDAVGNFDSLFTPAMFDSLFADFP